MRVDPLTSADSGALADLDDYAFVADPTRPERHRDMDGVDFDQAYGVRGDDVPLRGVYLFFDLQVAEPGPSGSVAAHPTAGLSWVGVHPDHRRRGVLSSMIRHHLRDVRDRGYAWGALTASETAIYGRFGYGVASVDVDFTLTRGVALQAPRWVREAAENVEVTTLMAVGDDEGAARVHAIEEANRAVVLGTITLPAQLSRAELCDIPNRRRDKEPLRALVARRDGRDVGIAVYRRTHSWDSSGDGEVEVFQLSYADDGVALALTRRLIDMDLMAKVHVSGRGLDDPLLWWALGPRDVEAKVSDAMWLRVLDVPTALGRRGYGAPLDVVLEVDDEILPENTGRFRLRAGADGVGECVRTDDAADLRCTVNDLGAVHLGLRGWRSLTAGGSVQALEPAAICRLDAAFATGVAPIGGLGF